MTPVKMLLLVTLLLGAALQDARAGESSGAGWGWGGHRAETTVAATHTFLCYLPLTYPYKEVRGRISREAFRAQ